jgi:hypothetical protein
MNKQSDDNTQFSTGAQRDDRKGKLRMSLMPHKGLDRIMKRYLDGAETYGENNWLKGMPYSALYDSAQRHLMQFWQEDSSEDHLAAAAWNIICLMQLENNSDLDDRSEFPN